EHRGVVHEHRRRRHLDEVPEVLLGSGPLLLVVGGPVGQARLGPLREPSTSPSLPQRGPSAAREASAGAARGGSTWLSHPLVTVRAWSGSCTRPTGSSA